MKQKTPGLSAEGSVCLHRHADISSPTIDALRCQVLSRYGIPANRAAIVARHCYGEEAQSYA